MKKLGMLIAIILMMTAISCKKEEGNGSSKSIVKNGVQAKSFTVSNEDILKLVPQDASILIKLKSVEDVYSNLLLLDSFTQDETQEIKDKIGFNPFSLEELKDNGVDPSRAIVWFMTDLKVDANNGENSSMNFMLMVPTSKSGKLLEKIKQEVQKSKKNPQNAVTITTEGNLTVIQDQKGFKVYLTEKDNYLLAAANPNEDAKGFINKVLKNANSITSNPEFKDIAKKVDSSEEFFGFVNIKKIVEDNLSSIENLVQKSTPTDVTEGFKYFKEMRGAAFNIDLESSDFICNIASSFTKNSESLKIYTEGFKMDKTALLGINLNPAVLLSLNLNASRYFNMLLNSLPAKEKQDLENGFASAKESSGIDIKEDVINNLGGSFNLGIYDGKSINMANYNLLASFNVKDQAKVETVIEKAIKTIPENQQAMIQKNGDSWAFNMGMSQAYLTVKDNNVMLTSSANMNNLAKSASLKSGFMPNLKDKWLENILENSLFCFYLGTSEISDAARTLSAFFMGMSQNQKPINPELFEKIKDIKYAVGYSNVDDHYMVGQYKIKTNFKEPFAIGLKKYIEELEKLSE